RTYSNTNTRSAPQVAQRNAQNSPRATEQRTVTRSAQSKPRATEQRTVTRSAQSKPMAAQTRGNSGNNHTRSESTSRRRS
uniref:hypothetical protein n=1 Tax=Mariniflexile sp. TaxID=1979402 RepID=UPI004047C38A